MRLVLTADKAGGLLLKLEAVHARQRPTVKRWRNSYDLIKDTQSVESTRDLGLDRREPDLTVLRGLDQDGWLSSSLREILAKVWRTATNVSLTNLPAGLPWHRLQSQEQSHGHHRFDLPCPSECSL